MWLILCDVTQMSRQTTPLTFADRRVAIVVTYGVFPAACSLEIRDVNGLISDPNLYYIRKQIYSQIIALLLFFLYVSLNGI